MSDAVKASGNNKHLGIDENRLRDLIEKVVTEIENVKSACNKMEEVVDDSTTYFKGDAGNAFREKFKDIMIYFPVLETCLASYQADLENFLDSYINYEGNYTLSDDVEGKEVTTTTGVSGFAAGLATRSN